MYNNMTIFKGKKGELDKINILTDASAALRENYEPTNEVLGEGQFGKVFVFTAKKKEGSNL